MIYINEYSYHSPKFHFDECEQSPPPNYEAPPPLNYQAAYSAACLKYLGEALQLQAEEFTIVE